MGDVSRLNDVVAGKERQTAGDLLPIIYDELRRLAAARLAAERPGQTLNPTALVHEAWLRLTGPGDDQNWDGRGHFFAAAAEAMRRILIDHARQKKSLRRGGDRKKLELEYVAVAVGVPDDDVLALNEALERFEQVDPVKANLVKLRYFAGLTIPEVAKAMDISSTTADRYWAYARAWLHAEMKKGDSEQVD